MPGLIQISGLPRSGTAFMSVFMSLCPTCIGVHELGVSSDDWREELHELLTEHRFVADCSTYAHIKKLRIQNGKRVFIVQDPETSRIKSEKAFKYTIPEGSFNWLYDSGLEWVNETHGMVIQLSDLFCVETLERVWKYAFEDESVFPTRKVTELIAMNIQRNKPDEVFSMKAGQQFVEKEGL